VPYIYVPSKEVRTRQAAAAAAALHILMHLGGSTPLHEGASTVAPVVQGDGVSRGMPERSQGEALAWAGTWPCLHSGGA
jgi:hypothetical protein